MSGKRTPGSAIHEVRQDLMLDTAEGKYLNVVTSNLGFYRPAYGFSDDTWRAVAKLVAADYKQIKLKFEEVLDVLIGPRTTRYSALAETARMGEKVLVLHSTEGFPQVGTIVLDEGLATEETVPYNFVDRVTNTVYLDSPLAFDHGALPSAARSVLLVTSPVTSTELYLNDVEKFPSIPTPVIISPGTLEEEVVVLSSKDDVQRTLTVTTTSLHHSRTRHDVVSSRVLDGYTKDTYVIYVDDVSYFPDSGFIQVTTPDSFTDAGTSTTTSIDIVEDVIPGSLVGYSITWNNEWSTIVANTNNNISISPAFSSPPSLGDAISIYSTKSVVSSTATDITFQAGSFIPGNEVGGEVYFFSGIRSIVSNTDSTITVSPSLGAPLSPGDLCCFLPRLEYVGVDRLNNGIVLKNPITYSIPPRTRVELLDTEESVVAVAQVQVKGVPWEVNEPKARQIEITIPKSIELSNTPRSAAYLHGDRQQNISDTLTANATAGTNQLAVADTSIYPKITTVDINGDVYSVFAVDATTLETTTPLINSYPSGTSIVEVDTALPNGVWDGNHQYGWLGPYLYASDEQVKKYNLQNPVYVTHPLAKPTLVAVDQVPGKTAVEVLDATFFPEHNSAQYPINIIVGATTGSQELVSVQNVSIRDQAYTALSASASAGATTFSVVDSSYFVNANGYRVLIDKGTPAEEVVYVTSLNTASHTFTCTPLANAHSSGASVELMADVLQVDIVDYSHTGVVPFAERMSAKPRFGSTRYALSHSVYITYDSSFPITLSSSVGLDTSGYLILNNSNNLVDAETTTSSIVNPGDTSITLSSVAGLPTTYYPYQVVLDPGTPTEERLLITGIVGTTASLAYPTRYQHAVGAKLIMKAGRQEIIEYTSLSSNQIVLTQGTVLRYNHNVNEQVVGGAVLDVPRPDGYDFAWHIPSSVIPRIRTILDRIRAAGVELKIITN